MCVCMSVCQVLTIFVFVFATVFVFACVLAVAGARAQTNLFCHGFRTIKIHHAGGLLGGNEECNTEELFLVQLLKSKFEFYYGTKCMLVRMDRATKCTKICRDYQSNWYKK